MKKSLTEKRLALVLFVMVLVVFSLAEKDSKQLVRLYSHDTPSAKAPVHPPAKVPANIFSYAN